MIKVILGFILFVGVGTKRLGTMNYGFSLFRRSPIFWYGCSWFRELYG